MTEDGLAEAKVPLEDPGGNPEDYDATPPGRPGRGE